MGSGASSLTPAEKVQISKSIKEKYDELMSKGNVSADGDTNLFQALCETYNQASSTIVDKKGASANSNDTSEASSIEEKGESKSFEFGEVDDEFHDEYDMPNFSRDGRLIRAKTSSQLLSETEMTALAEQEKIQNFISQLKAGEVQTKTGSEFRARRLTYTQKTSDGKTNNKSSHEIKVPRTSIYSSTEIGVKHETKAPFPANILGTYSCHGIEPSMEEENGIHEKINQDRGCIAYPYNSKMEEALFVVLDGHGEQGDKVSEFVMRQLVVSLEKDPNLSIDPAAALRHTFLSTNSALMTTQIRYMTSGCTCVTVYVRGSKLYVANCGDSRAVMAYTDPSKGGKLVAKNLSNDHKPDDPVEQARITASGGYVCPPIDVGLSARVYLDPEFTMIGLAMSRSIGDHAVKAVGVTADPEITIFDLNPSQDKFMIMASDGVWEFIDSQEAVEIVQKHISQGTDVACQRLIEAAALRWQEEEGDYRDDITAIVVKFPLPYLSS